MELGNPRPCLFTFSHCQVIATRVYIPITKPCAKTMAASSRLPLSSSQIDYTFRTQLSPEAQGHATKKAEAGQACTLKSRPSLEKSNIRTR